MVLVKIIYTIFCSYNNQTYNRASRLPTTTAGALIPRKHGDILYTSSPVCWTPFSAAMPAR